MSIVYMGAFPPGYGGVTIKNRNLYLALQKELPLKQVDFNQVKRKNIKEAIRFLFHVMNPWDRLVIGVSGKRTRKRLTQLLYYFNRTAMKKSILIVMGGTASHDMAIDSEYRKCAKAYKRIYVETPGMKAEMEKAGFENVAIYPNGRFRPTKPVPKVVSDGILRCVFFSLIQPEKGADLVLEAAASLPQVQFAFYGQIVDNYRESFLKEVNRLPNVSYQGVFQGSSEEVYAELAKYDVLLFPTRWVAEGVPGILVEGKIAGLAEIVSNHNYNAEIVTDGYDGIVMKDYSSMELSSAIQTFINNNTLLKEMSCHSKKAGEGYFIEKYLPEIVLCFK